MTRSQAAQAVISGAAAGLAMSAVLIAVIFYTGGTFGQRCAAVGFEWGTPLHAECVRLLNEGKEIRAGRTNNTPDDKEGG